MTGENREQSVAGKSADRESFVEYLKNASEKVQSWPIWKQSMLGSVPACDKAPKVESDPAENPTRDPQPSRCACDATSESPESKSS